jgi:hypothetical protein
MVSMPPVRAPRCVCPPGVLLDPLDALHDDAVRVLHDLENAAGAPFVATGDHDHLVALLVFAISEHPGASVLMRMYFLSRSSRPTAEDAQCRAARRRS